MKYVNFLIILVGIQVNLFAQVITWRGTSEWIEQQVKFYAKDDIDKYSVPPKLVEAKIT
jgi:hypothetical protein